MFSNFKETIEEMDTVILYTGKQQMTAIEVDSSKSHQTKFGCFRHHDFVGKKFGSKVYSTNGKGWMYLLYPTPELWTITLPHRTQILYSTDISLITLELDLKPGSIVVESGTGSGSLSHALIRTIKPNGHLHTFDFHEQRVEKAREEFTKHGVIDYVTIKVADACKDGFSMSNKADAVFLDLPAPWDAIPHAKEALKVTGGRLCSFSPCIEQVERTCAAMRKNGFCEIKTIECLSRNLKITTVPIPEANMGPKTLSEIIKAREARELFLQSKRMKLDNEQDSVDKESLREKKDEENKCQSTDEKENNLCDDSVDKESLREKKDEESECQSTDEKENNLCEDSVDEESVPEKKDEESECQSTDEKVKSSSGVNAAGMVTKLTAKAKRGKINMLTSKPHPNMPGHTGYLTFASLYPPWNNIEKEK